ncbi:phage major tail protein, TP901-1 family [Facklamia sp. P13069]|uniref:phage major tail protein, TP901-1 family n=1 Tax=Facklamia sp. P13069 TaxID=3421954 RepID=UPI003D178E65
MAKTEITAIRGKDKFLLFRLLSDAEKDIAAKLALQTVHEWKYERDSNSKPSKDGAVNATGGLTVELEIEAIASNDPVNNMLFESVLMDEKLEVWEVNMASYKEDTDDYEMLYARGNLNEWSDPNDVEDLAEISTTMSIDGRPVKGRAKLTDEQKLIIESLYGFRKPGEKVTAEDGEIPSAGA